MGHELKPLELPRGLIFLAALWLIGSWAITMGLSTPVQISSASYTPNFRRMLMCVVIGLMRVKRSMPDSESPAKLAMPPPRMEADSQRGARATSGTSRARPGPPPAA